MTPRARPGQQAANASLAEEIYEGEALARSRMKPADTSVPAPRRRKADPKRQRREDAELFDHLASTGFTGPDWQLFRRDLAGYGHSVISAWLATGEIFRQCQLKGCPVGPVPLNWNSSDGRDLVNDVVARGLVNFTATLRAGGWTETGGASLKTFFIGHV